jgi:hypothetical protein
MEIPPGYELTKKPRRGLVLAGLVTAASAYGLSLTFGSVALTFDSDSEYGLLLIPFAGPFMTIAADEYMDGFATGILILDAISQIGGTAMLIAGFVAKEQVLERRDKILSRPAPEFFVGPGSVGMRMKF